MMEDLHQKYGAKGLVILAVNVDENTRRHEGLSEGSPGELHHCP